MRTYNKLFGAYNSARSKERRFAVQIDMGGGEILWVVSHPDVEPGTGTVLQARTESLSNVSQRLNPDEGRAEIGTLAFGAVDVNRALTAELRAQLAAERGILGKRVALYIGDRRIPFSAYELDTTQVLDRVRVEAGGITYRFTCRDVQRLERSKIMAPKETRLTAPVGEDDTTIHVLDAQILEGVDHGPSFSDAPDTAGVIYFKIDDEIIRTLAADATATSFQNCERGVLGTRAAEHATDEGATVTADKGKKVTEIIYLELPVPKLAHAVQTGILIGQLGTLPEHWHAGMGADDVKLTEYQSIGLDIYDPNDDTAGVIFRFVDPGEQDAKQFVERDLMRPLSLFQPVRADGQLGMRRLRRIAPGAATVTTLDDSCIQGPVALEYDGTRIANIVELKWNEVAGELTRSVVVQDTASIVKWGERELVEVEARGLHGSRQSRDVVVQMIQQFFDRRSGPPIRTSITVLGSRSGIEVGDVVRVRTTNARDWTQPGVTSIDRPFEVQEISKDWLGGTCTLTLEASSEDSSLAILPLVNDEAIPDAWFSSAGTDLATVPGVTDLGDRLEVGTAATLNGGATLGAPESIFYSEKDFTLAAGATLTYTGNVQLRVKSVTTINGTMDGSGQGLPGVSDTLDTSSIPSYPETRDPVDITYQAGQPGGFGVTQANGGIIERVRQENEGSGYHGFIQSVEAPLTEGAYDVLPLFQVSYQGGLQGLPRDLRGSSGGPGGLRYWEDSRPAPNQIDVNRGGAGGAGGAGLAIISRGVAFGASGLVRTNGADGALGGYNSNDKKPAHAGSGAGGAPGGTLFLIDGALNPAPSSLSSNLEANYGESPLPADGTYNDLPRRLISDGKFFIGTDVPEDRYSLDRSTSSGVDAVFAATRVQFMPPSSTAVADETDEDVAATESISIALSEIYGAVADDGLTVVRATITEDDTSPSYSHANIYYRTTAGPGPWVFAGPAEPSRDFQIPADGVEREVVGVPVLTNGLQAPFSTRSTASVITVTNGATGINFDIVNGANKPENRATRNQIFRQTTPPTATAVGDIWYDTDDALLYRWGGASWVLIANAFDDTAELSDGANLGDTAIWASITGGGKPEDSATRNQLFRQTTAPTASSTGDLWYDTDDELLYRWSGSSWVLYAPSGGQTATTVTDSDSGTTSAQANIVRGGAQTQVNVSLDLSGAAFGGGDPFPVAVVLRRGGPGGTIIKQFTNIYGHFEAGAGGDPDFVFLNWQGSFIDTNTGTGLTGFYVSGPNTAYNETLEVTATQTYFS